MPSKSNNICNRNRNINNSDFVMAFTEKKLLFLAIILNGIFLVYILKIEDETDKLDVSSSKYQQSSLFHHRHSTRKHDQKNPKTKPWTKKVKDTLVNLVNLLPKHLKHVKKPSEEINKQTLVKKPTKQLETPVKKVKPFVEKMETSINEVKSRSKPTKTDKVLNSKENTITVDDLMAPDGP
jgi:hypothetical protein